jgi:hypothetical protein
MKYWLLVLTVGIGVVLVAVWWQLGRQSAVMVTSFEECGAAGNPVMESYPRQCRHGDQLFVEDVVVDF